MLFNRPNIKSAYVKTLQKFKIVFFTDANRYSDIFWKSLFNFKNAVVFCSCKFYVKLVCSSPFSEDFHYLKLKKDLVQTLVINLEHTIYSLFIHILITTFRNKLRRILEQNNLCNKFAKKLLSYLVVYVTNMKLLLIYFCEKRTRLKENHNNNKTLI